ncbi:MAG: NAD(P)-dependent oxidoreductase [Candidatus Omnitrophica bacterium]|nr:NAD(P)-dependent oxidoreductase [Candidatus Omnitrophota bacterium]HOX53833.1 NAD(P)-dependent oxidoreductase [Candidatus Omnitrophota bacterium]
MKIFVTGATGFIGSHLVEKLIQEKHQVTAYVRKTSNLEYLPKEANIVYGDICDYSILKKSLIGFDAVYHNAALVSDWAKKEDFYRINLEGTKNVFNAIKENNIKKLILTSSAGVLGEEDCTIPKNETSPYKPRTDYFLSNIFESDLNHYRISKMLAEKETIEFCRHNEISLTIIRPVWVYGEREFNAGPFHFCQAVSSGLSFAPVGKTNRFHVVYVGDLVSAMVLVLEKKLSGINIFLIGNQKAPLAREYLGLFCKYLNLKMPMMLPKIFFKPIGFTLELCYKLFNVKKTPLLTRSRVDMFYCNNIYDVSKAERELGFVASTPLEEGIKKTVNWWIENAKILPER